MPCGGRYGGGPRRAETLHWRRNAPVTEVRAGCALMVEAEKPFTLDLTFDGGAVAGLHAEPRAFGLHGVILDPTVLHDKRRIDFRYHSDEPESRRDDWITVNIMHRDP